ncbi:MAG: ATP-binding protein, partial [Pseudomonadota bacterium]
MMDLVTSSSIMRAVLQGSYTPRLDTFDASSICRSIHSDPNTITASPSSILVQTDSRLFRFILENAVSNARKYGLHCGPIAITMRTRQVVRDDDQTLGGTNLDKRSWLNVCVENKPGPGHERLLALDDCNRIFDQGTRFHDHDGAFKMRQLGSERNRISAGDGGWIMQQSARALGGYCSITFSPTHTNFSLDIPACIISEGEQRVFEPSSNEDSTAKACAVTADSTSLFLVALDDAPSQCRLLERYFKHIGLKDRSVIWQATSSIIDHFVPMAMDVVRREYAQNRKAKVVFF